MPSPPPLPFCPGILKFVGRDLQGLKLRVRTNLGYRRDGHLAKKGPAHGFLLVGKSAPAISKDLDLPDLAPLVIEFAVEQDRVLWVRVFSFHPDVSHGWHDSTRFLRCRNARLAPRHKGNDSTAAIPPRLQVNPTAF